MVDHEFREAAALYLATGQLERACRIYAKLGEIRSLVEVMRRCKAQKNAQLRAEYGQPKLQGHRRTLDGSGEYPEDYETSVALRLIACIFEESGQVNLAQEALLALGDTVGYLRVLMQAGRWDEAVSRAEQVSAVCAGLDALRRQVHFRLVNEYTTVATDKLEGPCT